MWALGVRTRPLESPKKPLGQMDQISGYMYQCTCTKCVQSTHVYICMLGGRMRSWTIHFFSFNIFSFKKRKAKDGNVRPSKWIHMDLSYIDPPLKYWKQSSSLLLSVRHASSTRGALIGEVVYYHCQESGALAPIGQAAGWQVWQWD